MKRLVFHWIFDRGRDRGCDRGRDRGRDRGCDRGRDRGRDREQSGDSIRLDSLNRCIDSSIEWSIALDLRPLDAIDASIESIESMHRFV